MLPYVLQHITSFTKYREQWCSNDALKSGRLSNCHAYDSGMSTVRQQTIAYWSLWSTCHNMCPWHRGHKAQACTSCLLRLLFRNRNIEIPLQQTWKLERATFAVVSQPVSLLITLEHCLARSLVKSCFKGRRSTGQGDPIQRIISRSNSSGEIRGENRARAARCLAARASARKPSKVQDSTRTLTLLPRGHAP